MSITADTNYVAVWSSGRETTFVCSPDDDIWIALAEQLPADDPTCWIEYVEDSSGELVDY
jgi:hypothetical protein